MNKGRLETNFEEEGWRHKEEWRLGMKTANWR